MILREEPVYFVPATAHGLMQMIFEDNPRSAVEA
jgi:hypothetical protein